MDRHHICIPVDSNLDPADLRSAALEGGIPSVQTTIDHAAVRVEAEDPYARLRRAEGQVHLLREALKSHGWTDETIGTLITVATPSDAPPVVPAPVASGTIVKAAAAPKPVGAYPHARRVGELLYLSGVGPRQPETDAVPGGPIRDSGGNPQPYDIEAQTRAVIENVRIILEASGSSLDKVLDITTFLVDMDRDFAGYNKVYAEYFTSIQATRTTLAITALPTPIAIELKVIALA